MFPFYILSAESEFANSEKKITTDHLDFGDDIEDEQSENFHNRSIILVESPEPSIRMVSPEPSALPREFSNMKYSQLNKIILSMSSDVNEEDDDTDSEPRIVSGLTGEEKSTNDSYEDDPFEEMDVKLTSNDRDDEDTNEITDAFPDLNLLNKG